MNTDTQQELENLENLKKTIQQEISEINSRISLIHPNCFFSSLDSTINSMVASYESQRQSLMHRIFDIQAKIDELKH